MTKARDLADFISTGAGTGILADGAIDVAEISDLTATANEINKLSGLTVTTEELNNVAGINTSVQTQLDGKQPVVAGVSSTEIGYLDGVTSALQTQLDSKQAIVAGVSDAEIGYLDGVTSNLQTQLNNITVTAGTLTKSFASGETASIALSAALSPAPVVSATKEVAQAGISSKGAWDVNATASNYELHNTAYATTLLFSGSDVSTATYSQNFDASTQDGQALDAVFKTDGTKMYVLGGTSDTVYEYNLSTAWDISTSSYSNNSFSVASQETAPSSLFFKPDGTKMYTVGSTNNTVYEYNLSTAWDISTASYANNNFSVAFKDTVSRGVSFKSDGTKMFIVGGQYDAVYEYNLSTAWDVSTSSYFQGLMVGSQESSPVGLHFIADGTKMYVVGAAGQDINEYSLSTAWNVSTGSFVTNFSTSSQTASPASVFFETNGTKMFVCDTYTGEILEYNIATLLTLGTGSFASTDVGKRIQGNGGDVTLTSTAGAYDTTGGSAFTDSSVIASGSWSMRGLKSAGDADGIGFAGITEAGTPFSFTYSSSSFLQTDQWSTTKGIALGMSPDGTKAISVGSNQGTGADPVMQQWSLSTAHDITTKTLVAEVALGHPNGETNLQGGWVNSTGTVVYVGYYGLSSIEKFTLSTPWDISTKTRTSVYSTGSPGLHGLAVNSDETTFYIGDGGSSIKQYTMSTAGDLTTASYASKERGNMTSRSRGLDLVADDFIVVSENYGTVKFYKMSTPNDINSSSSVGQATIPSFNNYTDSLSYANGYLYVTRADGHVVKFSFDGTFTGGPIYVQPTSQYHIAVTNSGGQIDSLTWTDINSMTADQAAGDGTVHYAVSTDDRTTWSVAKASDGVRPIVRDNAGTWQYNNASTYAGTTWVNGSTNDEFYTLQESLGNGIAEAAGTFSSLSNVTYDSVDFAVGSQDADPRGVAFSTDGTKMFVAGNSGDSIYQYTLSTAHDISTATYNSSFAAQGTNVLDVVFNSDGTKMYAPSVSPSPSSIYEYDLSTAFDITTVTYNSVSLNISSQSTGTVHGISFNDDGTKLYTAISGSSVYEYVLSTAYDLSTASYNNLVFNAQSQVSDISGVTFNSDGTKMFISDNGTDAVYQYSLNTPFSIGTVTYDNVSISLSSQDSDIEGVTFSSDFTKMYIAGSSNNKIYQYSTGLTVSNHNRMDKTQLDAVADGSHFTLGDTLDLAIALRQDTASASTPKSDGVSINYDAQALNQGAVLGTDYDYDFPDSTTVRVTSNAAQNLKIRVV